MILVVEDNIDVNAMIKECLQTAGYDVESAYDGLEGMRLIKEKQYDLILLDLMLPYLSGDQILKEVRESSDVPIVVISAKDLVGTKIDLLRLGADDYITKPFDLGEVVARVESVLRRFTRQTEKNRTYVYKDLILDENSKRVMVASQELILTSKEYEILELLLKNQGKVYTKANLYETVWKEQYLGDDNAVKTHMSNLRAKIKKLNSNQEYIETVWGIGYRLYP